jgi:hypothetical protein
MTHYVLLISVVLAVSGVVDSCHSKPLNDTHGNTPLRDDAIYINDAYGRCLRLELGVETSGSRFEQQGLLDVYVVSTTNCVLEKRP